MTTCDTTQAEESSWHISKHEQHEEPSTYRYWDQGAGVQFFDAWLLLKIEHIFGGLTQNSNTECIFGGTSTLNIISDLVLHSCIRSVALHFALLCPFLGCRSFHFQKGDCYESNTNLHEACLQSFFRNDILTHTVYLCFYANRKYHDFGIQLAHLITKR